MVSDRLSRNPPLTGAVHLYYWWDRTPGDLSHTRIGFGLCSARVLKPELTADPRRVTCERCREKLAKMRAEGGAAPARPAKKPRVVTAEDASLLYAEDVTNSDLVEAYNRLAEGTSRRRVERFRSLEDGKRALRRLAKEVEGDGQDGER